MSQRDRQRYIEHRHNKAQYYRDNKGRILKQKKEYAANNTALIAAKNKRYVAENRDIINKKRNEYRQKSLQFKISYYLRNRLNKAIRNKQKVGSAVQDLGCTIEELKTYLESKFLPGMTWGNYGYKTWHIDHIIPLSSFDLTDRDQFLKACHYTNLQPLWAKDNLSKGSKHDQLG